MDRSKRGTLGVLTSLGLAWIPQVPTFAQSSAIRPPRADQVMWGGFGFSSANLDVPKVFPLASQALSISGGSGKLAMAFAERLSTSYPGGVTDDPSKLLDSSSDPALLFSVSLDFEQMILVPNEGNQTEFQLSFIYASSQILYLDLPRSGGGDGDLRVLYSFPFRVQSGETPRVGSQEDRIKNFKSLLFDLENSLLNTFTRKVASKRFREAKLPKRLKVTTISITPEATTVIKDLGLENSLTPQFFGQALTASLAEKGDISVLPFAQNDLLNGALASRFDRFPSIEQIFKRLDDPLENNYTIELIVHRVLRRSNGSNIGNVLYARGISIFIKVDDIYKKQTVFNKKVLLLENNELPKAMLDRLQDYDLRYLTQITIKLFDSFAEGVVKKDSDKLKAIGLNPSDDMAEVNALDILLSTCRY